MLVEANPGLHLVSFDDSPEEREEVVSKPDLERVDFLSDARPSAWGRTIARWLS